jgi:hypothetical protein
MGGFMKTIFLLAAAIAAAPASAQVGAAAPAAAAAAEPLDARRLAAATATVEHIWPIGTYERMMRGTMQQMTQQVASSMFDMKIGEIAGAAGDGGKLKPEEAEMTLREAAMKADPHFEERMTITNRVMMEEMVPIMARLEPGIRAGLARAYARKFSAEQLADLNRFFATPAGDAYARESLMLWVDPEVVAAISGFGPEMMREMPGIMAKVTAATAHLPPPRRTPKEDGRSRR